LNVWPKSTPSWINLTEAKPPEPSLAPSEAKAAPFISPAAASGSQSAPKEEDQTEVEQDSGDPQCLAEALEQMLSREESDEVMFLGLHYYWYFQVSIWCN
jgi:hypothetical protein